MTKTDDGILVTTQNGSVFLDRTGALTSWLIGGEQMLQAPLEPYFWKPENDNQRAAGFARRLALWKDAAQNRIINSIRTEKDESTLKVIYNISLPSVGTGIFLTYAITSNGHIQVDMNYMPIMADIPLIPKFGMRLRLPADYTHIDYYGRGPWENYPDRQRSAFVGRYQMPLSQFETEYVHPQDNGCRTDVRWLSISNGQHTLRIDGCQPLCIRAWDYGEEDLEEAKHPHEIQRGNFVNLNIDLNLHGVGGADTWGQRTLPQYTIDGNQPHHYAFILKCIH